MRSLHLLMALLATTMAASSGLMGQNVAVDEGAFRLSINGQLAGREEFSIRRAGSGPQARVVLRGSVQLSRESGSRNLAPALEAGGPELSVMAYQLKVSGDDTSEIYLTRSDGRFLAKAISSQGEQLREFRAGPGSVVLDEDVAHHHYLLTPFLDDQVSVSLTVLSPSAGRQHRMTLTALGEVEIRIGTSLVNARHFRLEGGSSSREIWFDDQGRVLRVEIPALGFVADREGMT